MLKKSRIFFYKKKKEILKTIIYCLVNISSNKFLLALRKKITVNLFLTAQGRVALYYICKFLITKGYKKFYISPYTNIDVINALNHAGCEIIILDLDIKTGYPSNIDQVLFSKEKCCMIITHLYSNNKNINNLYQKLKNRKDNIKIIEDAAIVFGSKLEEKFLGNLFDYGFFSFGLLKNLNTFFGGAILYNDEEFKYYYEEIENNRLIKFSVPFMLKKIIFSIIMKIAFNQYIYNLFTIHILKLAYLNKDNFLYKFFYPQKFAKLEKNKPNNYNYKYPYYLSNIAIEHLHSQEEERNQRFEKVLYYYNNLKHIKFLQFQTLSEIDRNSNSYLEYPIVINGKNKYDLLRFLRKYGIFIREYWYSNLSGLINNKERIENLDYLEKNLITLPCHPKVNKEYQDYLIKYLKEFFEK